MKVAIVTTGHDYDGYEIAECFLVPNSVDLNGLRQRWNEETGTPFTGKNQHGRWRSNQYHKHTVPFRTWLEQNFRRIEHADVGD